LKTKSAKRGEEVMTEAFEDHKIIPENQRIQSRRAELEKEKVLRDQLSQQRRDLHFRLTELFRVFRCD